ncbi:MAG: TIGR03960 family B12-binding radical SAM protein [Phycisphaerae bacterium]|nr:TIGR03960 family B12-binding radical SAM protein [Phycisphaerae bacterium]
MKPKHIEILQPRLERDFLPFVRQPGRYIGGEVNQIVKDLTACDVTFALCFPDVYEIAMSHTGLAILYDVLNRMDGVAAERVFAPWIDAEQVLRERQIPLYTLESKAAVSGFDAIGFSLNNELCYTNMLNILDLAGLAVRASERTEDDPIVIAGGQAANVCEPFADFVDLCLLGDGEEAVVQLAELLRQMKTQQASKRDFLLAAARAFDFVYVPSLYAFEYADGRIVSFAPKEPDLRVRFQNAVVEDFDGAAVPEKPIVPFVKAVHERVSVEIMRGCPGRCRFCQASFCRRPVRYRSVERIVEIAKANYAATGFDTVSLLSLSTADYPDIEELVVRLQDYFAPRHVGLSLPSLKVKQQLQLLPKLVTSVRKSGLTIAVEAASETLRSVINKPITDEDLFAGVRAAYSAGFQHLKLYFMVGLPGETEEDVRRIAVLSEQLARLRQEVDGKVANINVAVSWLVPKPHTPFAWLAQQSREYFQMAKDLILQEKRRLNARFLQFKFHSIENSILEAAVARGDRRLGAVIETAWRRGAKFDLWNECFDAGLWAGAFEACGMDLDSAAQRRFAADEILPWEHLGGPEKSYLLKHHAAAVSAAEAG